MEWPQYPNRGITMQEMQDIERRQHKYKAYHGFYPWERVSPEIEDSESEGGEDLEEEVLEHRDMYCPHSLEDTDLLRAITFAFETARYAQNVHGNSQQDVSPALGEGFPCSNPPASSLCPLSLVPADLSINHPFPNQFAVSPTMSAPSAPTEANGSSIQHVSATSDPCDHRHEEIRTRLRPKDKLKKTERAKKIYRH
ncbi:hypothetical protein NMY22_g17155 [Coprinellus aureogranulatus]|nr:hypothetical protein NMY22_g17155 [Coprinellus aureogranulatus]